MKEKPKLLYIGNALSKHGFTQTTVETLGSKLSEHFDVTITSSIRNPILRMLDIIYCILKNRKSDYVLLDTYSTMAFWFAFISGLTCNLLRIKYIPILHGGDLPKRAQRSSYYIKIFLNNSYCIVSPSPFLKKALQNFTGKTIRVIKNSLNVDDYSYRSNFPQISNPLKLLWLRSFHKIYNPILAVKILIELHKRNINAKLCMIGPDKDGSMSDVIKQIEINGLRGSVEITGRLEKKEWIKKSRDFNLFINTTNHDNTPVSVLEAMALGLPVISTNVGGLPFLIENKYNGILVELDNEIAFANAIESIIQDEELYDKLSKNGRKLAESYSWENIKQEWIDLLNPSKQLYD